MLLMKLFEVDGDAVVDQLKNVMENMDTMIYQVYDYLRCEELGISMGEMPKLESFNLKYESGAVVEADVLEKLTYDGLLKLPH